MPIKDYPELVEVLQARTPTMAPGQQRIADLILRDPAGTAFRTVGQTALKAGVHQSSVVRFAQLLELPGYPALVALCRSYVAGQASLMARFDTATGVEKGDLFAKVLDQDRENLTRTYAQIDRESWETVVRLVSHAPAVHVLGLRKCLSVAQLLAYLLRLLRPGVHHLAPAESELVDDLRDLKPDDVFIAIAIRRYTASTVRAIKHAHGKGLHTVALTDDQSSPLVELADHTFFMEANGVTILRSLTVFTSVCQALATAVAIERGQESRSELELDEDLLDAFAVYTR